MTISPQAMMGLLKSKKDKLETMLQNEMIVGGFGVTASVGAGLLVGAQYGVLQGIATGIAGVAMTGIEVLRMHLDYRDLKQHALTIANTIRAEPRWAAYEYYRLPLADTHDRDFGTPGVEELQDYAGEVITSIAARDLAY